MADVPEFHLVLAEEFKDDSMGSTDTKAPHFVMFGVELLCVEGWVNGFSRKRSVLEAALRWIGFGSLEKRLSMVAVVETRACSSYAINSRSDLRFVTRPALWSFSDASNLCAIELRRSRFA